MVFRFLVWLTLWVGFTWFFINQDMTTIVAIALGFPCSILLSIADLIFLVLIDIIED